jgi:hypothetical protein
MTVPTVCQSVAFPQCEPPYQPVRFPARVPQAKGSAPANATVAPYTSHRAFTAIVPVSHHEFNCAAHAASSPRE